MARPDREVLSLGYRFRWRLRYILLSVFGPAQLGTQEDPQSRLRREREAKVAVARDARRQSGARGT